jgi:uncharacterized protein (DUF1697 family)
MHRIVLILFRKNKNNIKRLIEKLTGSYLAKIIKTPMWQNITIRNLNTTRKLYELLLERRDLLGGKEHE